MGKDEGRANGRGDVDDNMTESSGSSVSLSDEISEEDDFFYDSILKAKRTIDRRMLYFRNHFRLLRIEGGKIIDLLGNAALDASQSTVSSMKGNIMETLPDRSESVVPSDGIKTIADAPIQAKQTAEWTEKMKLFQNMRMKKLLTVDKLNEYLELLEKKEKLRFSEEGNTVVKKFKFGGPSREGPLFCLREQYRRERKHWRVKYARKYGILCARMRLEKRLMRKAKRLLTKDHILNALKDKVRSKLGVLMEMRNEFKKLVDRLKLNKEIQEKIKRQDRLTQHLKKTKPAPRARGGAKAVQSHANPIQTSRTETAEVQKSRVKREKKSMTGIDEELNLPPLPSVPSFSGSSHEDLTNRKKASEKHLKRTLRAEQDVCHSPTTDKKLRILRNETGDPPDNKQPACSPPNVARKAKNERRQSRIIEELKCRASPVQRPEGSSLTSVETENLDETFFNWPKLENTSKNPKGFVRKSEADFIPPNRYRLSEEKAIRYFIPLYRRLLEDQLDALFGAEKPDETVDAYVVDIKRMSDYLMDNIHLLQPSEQKELIDNLIKLKFDKRFTYLNRGKKGSDTQRQSIFVDPMTRNALKLKDQIQQAKLKQIYRQFKDRQLTRKTEFRYHKINFTKRRKTKEESKDAHKRRRTLVDKLLLKRETGFSNPVRVTTKLGGKLMLHGWKLLSYEEYAKLGTLLPVEKSGWRRDGMENYEVIAPSEVVDGLMYLLILNRLDLTPRRFKFSGYIFKPHAYRMMKHCSEFYRNYILRKGSMKTEKKQLQNHPLTTDRPRAFMGSDMLFQGEFRVPHLQHRIFIEPGHVKTGAKPKDKHTPMIFSKRSEVNEFDDEDPKKLRIRLRETATLHLWGFESVVSLKGTEEALEYLRQRKIIEKERLMYKRCFERSTQAEISYYFDVSTQIDAPTRDSKKTNVHDTDISKAAKDPLPIKAESARIPGFQDDDAQDEESESSDSTTASCQDDNVKIIFSKEFTSKMNLTARIMDSSIYSGMQMAYRRGQVKCLLDPQADVAHGHQRLLAFIDKRIALSEYVVSCMAWSLANPNLLAVGYARHPLYPEQEKGMLCIWNIKFISKYQRKFEFNSSVTHLEFCIPYPRLLNVALLNGSVMILDLGAKDKALVVTTKLSSIFSDHKPVWQFSWMEIDKGKFVPITCGENGFIHQLRPDGTFQHSKFLSLGHREGKVKGIKISPSMGLKPRLRDRPGIICLEKHPKDPTSYLVGTSDGCVHICSIHFRNQHLDVFSAHVGAVRGIQFHPDCEHVFLTYGDDFYVRIWLYGVFQPALELMSGTFYVRCARWSPVNPEILVSLCKQHIDVWDIRRKTDTPVHMFRNPRQLENSYLTFDKSGNNIAVGNVGGDVYIYSLTNMPYVPYYKEEAVASALKKTLKGKSIFFKHMKKIGYPFDGTRNRSS